MPKWIIIIVVVGSVSQGAFRWFRRRSAPVVLGELAPEPQVFPGRGGNVINFLAAKNRLEKKHHANEMSAMWQ